MSIVLSQKETVQWYEQQSKKMFSWIQYARESYPILPLFSVYKETSKVTPIVVQEHQKKELSEVIVIQDDTLSQMEKGELEASSKEHHTKKKEFMVSQFEGKMLSLAKKRSKAGAMPYIPFEQWREQYDEYVQHVYVHLTSLNHWIEEHLSLLQENMSPTALDAILQINVSEEKKKKTWNQCTEDEKMLHWSIFLLRLCMFLEYTYNQNKNATSLPLFSSQYQQCLMYLNYPLASWEKHVVWDRSKQCIIHYKKLWWNYENTYWVIECVEDRAADMKKKVKALFH
jgi:hypothetical protein